MPKQEPCRTCGGSRKVLERVSGHFDAGEVEAPCPDCGGTGEGLSELAQMLLKASQGHDVLLQQFLHGYAFAKKRNGDELLAEAVAELLYHTRQQERERLMFGVRRVFGHLPELVRQYEALLEATGTLFNEGSGEA